MILDPQLTAAYVVLATVLAVSPGPDVLYVIANGMRYRARGAVAAALGIGAGSLVHAVAASAGLFALISASPTAFDILRLMGAVYLAYLGLRSLRAWIGSGDAQGIAGTDIQASFKRQFQQGMVTNLLNPKVIAFYLALLPQFVNIDLGHIGMQMFLLASIHNAIGIAFLMAVGLAAGRASAWLAKGCLKPMMDGIAGIIFLGLALRLAVGGRAEP